MLPTQKAADTLRTWADHFVEDDWVYSNDTKFIEKVRFSDDSSLKARCGRLGTVLVRRFMARRSFQGRDSLGILFSKISTLELAKTFLARENYIPDGTLRDRTIFTYWFETGYYLQTMQPSVAMKVADVLENYPGVPEVEALAAEINRVSALGLMGERTK